MKEYMRIDDVVNSMTAQQLADYLLNNWEGYAEELATELSLQAIMNAIKEREDDK